MIAMSAEASAKIIKSLRRARRRTPCRPPRRCWAGADGPHGGLRSAPEAGLRGLQAGLHQQKTKLVYCKDEPRGDHPIQSFDFLGYEFRPRSAIWHGGQLGVSFLPAISPKALKAIRQTVRRWALHRRSDKSLDDLARMFNPYIQGWINYYGHFYRSRLLRELQRIDALPGPRC